MTKKTDKDQIIKKQSKILTDAMRIPNPNKPVSTGIRGFKPKIKPNKQFPTPHFSWMKTEDLLYIGGLALLVILGLYFVGTVFWMFINK
jgi:hypothetical protein